MALNKSKPAGKSADKEAKGMKIDPKAFLAAAKAGMSQWKKSRTVEPKTGGGIPEDFRTGTYNAQLIDASLGVKRVDEKNGRITKKVDAPSTQIKFKLVGGSFPGFTTSQFQTLNSETGWNIFSETIQKLGYDTKEMELADVPGVIDELKKEQPYVSLYIKREDSEQYGTQLRVYVNKVLDEAPADADENGGDDSGDDTTTESGGDETYADMGQRIDDGDDDAADLKKTLNAIGKDYELSEADYETWAEFGTALDEASTEAGGESEGEDDEVDLDALGEQADDGDKDARKQLVEYGSTYELDEADYETWAEFATAIGEAAEAAD